MQIHVKFVKSQNCATDSHFRTVILLHNECETVVVSIVSTTLLHMDETMLLRPLSLKSQLLSSDFYIICSFFLKPRYQFPADEVR